MRGDYRKTMLETGRDRALASRNEGGSTVTVVRTTGELYARIGRADCDNFDLWLLDVQQRVADAIEGFRVDALRRAEGLSPSEDIPF